MSRFSVLKYLELLTERRSPVFLSIPYVHGVHLKEVGWSEPALGIRLSMGALPAFPFLPTHADQTVEELFP